MADEHQDKELRPESGSEEATNEPIDENAAEEALDGASAEAVEAEVALPPPLRPVANRIQERYPSFQFVAQRGDWLEVHVPAAELKTFSLFIRDTSGLEFTFLSSLSAVDLKDRGFQVVYHLLNLQAGRKLVVKVTLPTRENPTVDTVMDVWPTADWHEREAWDLMGIKFEGHPDLRRILMREDWEGHPLRKDYVDHRPPRDRQRKEDYEAQHRAK